MQDILNADMANVLEKWFGINSDLEVVAVEL